MPTADETLTRSIVPPGQQTIPCPQLKCDDYFRALTGNIIALRADAGQAKSIGICSCEPREGVTTVATNLAMAAASSLTTQVLLVEANLTRPSFSKSSGVRAATGWRQVIRDGIDPPDAIYQTRHPQLSVMFGGADDDRSCPVYDPHHTAAVIGVLKQKFELVIFDLPACNELTGCFAIANCLDGVLLVLESDRIRSAQARRALGQLEQSGATVVGTLLNKHRSYVPSWLRRWIPATLRRQ